MGCDIHMYPEFRWGGDDGWDSFGWGSFNPGRDYSLFACLAGVRGEEEPVVAPRGIPDDLGWTAHDDYFFRINHEGHSGGDKYVTPEEAQRWVSDYGSKYEGEVRPMQWQSSFMNFATGEVESKRGMSRLPHDGKPSMVSNPDAHTPSWVTLDELEAAIDRSRWASEAHEYRAIAAALRYLESNGYRTRIVFWFDN
jgi:hypothetical protein